MPWRPLAHFRDPTVPKLHNLRRASDAGLEVPPTVWAAAAGVGAEPAPQPPDPADVPGPPWIVRSGSPTEDTTGTSNAGRFLSLVVRRPEEFADSALRVVGALPVVEGRRLGVVFVQPWLHADRAGVTFFDGFYFEETEAEGGNAALTAGADRGDVRRGHLRRGDPHHDWLSRVQRVFGGTVDLEWALPVGHEGPPVLLQARPALFPVLRSETLSLANHKEILGDPPSPWMVGLLADVARPVMDFFEKVDPAIADWEEPYAVELGERAWLNFSAFFRMMDRWGLPRAMVTEGVGGQSDGPADARLVAGRFARSVPTLCRLQWANLRGLLAIDAGFRTLDESLGRAGTLADLQRVNAEALAFAIRTNFAINGMLAGLSKVRRALGLDRAARLVTQEMMAGYAAVAALPDRDARHRALDGWLDLYGHRGPLESDPRQPRFSELRESLRADLDRGPARPPAPRSAPPRWLLALARPLFLVDERREAFRDRLMRWWQRLRAEVLAGARRAVDDGHLSDPDDVFFLRRDDLQADPSTWKPRAADRRKAFEGARLVALPDTAGRVELEALLAEGAAGVAEGGDPAGRFRGIGLGKGPVVGRAVRASSLGEVLGAAGLPESPVLVVATLEPSWALVFPRFAAVVTDLGGELSHAAILLREAGIPAVINARGVFGAVADGDLVCVDPRAGEVRKSAQTS